MNPQRSNSSLPKPGRSAYGVATAVVLLLIPVVVLYGGNWLQEFLNFGAGVVALVLLSCSVIWGLVAQDRLLLNIRQRIVAQAVHRVTAVGSIAFLVVHIGIKLAIKHTVWIAAVIPFGLGFTGIGGLIGLGTLAGLLMIFVGVTGALRNQFASPAPVAARWRAMHMLAYPAWCAAIVHGLYAGRAVKSPLFTYLYELSLLAVMAALALRAAPRPYKRKIADRLLAIFGSEEGPGRDGLEESRARNAEAAALAGFGSRSTTGRSAAGGGVIPPQPSAPLFEAPAARTMTPESGDGFAAAYRAVSPTPRGQTPMGPDPTQRMNMPLDMQATEAMPRVDGAAGTSGSWPIPSPPPVGEAPRSAYDPLNDTGYTIPAYGTAGYNGYGTGDMYDTGETNVPYGTYNPNDQYNSGPTAETRPGAYDTPGAGEAWNAPSGGFK
ncbi:cytochrome b/b6 domain-containing protein [Streptomyces sp. NPDC007264]|uniref:cytochrome b/b6 domain-containing protein n=1 Tax=Streptomyces sp. NPDC007264 TaxID=3364777 RepID=UPI0036DADB9A